MIRAAGVLFLTPDNKALFLKRGPDGDTPGTWCAPGGKHEDDETTEDTAIRETFEETGFTVEPETLKPHTRSIRIAEAGPSAMPALAESAALPVGPAGAVVSIPVGEDVDFTTYLVRVPEPFVPAPDDEHVGFAWSAVDAPPEPLHPGVRIALDRLTMDELGVARAMAAGLLTSPQVYYNMVLFAIRITGTGVAFRSALKEFVLRDPAIYMNDDFLARCNGLPVILRHPKIALNSKEFKERIVGTTFLPYLRPELGEVWAVVKIYDADAVEAMASIETSTSPCVLFPDTSVNTKLRLTGEEDGNHILIEGNPGILDHIAILPGGPGVWDKGRGLNGVDQTGVEIMADSEPIGLTPGDCRRIEHKLILLNVQMSNTLSRRQA